MPKTLAAVRLRRRQSALEQESQTGPAYSRTGRTRQRNSWATHKGAVGTLLGQALQDKCLVVHTVQDVVNVSRPSKRFSHCDTKVPCHFTKLNLRFAQLNVLCRSLFSMSPTKYHDRRFRWIERGCPLLRPLLHITHPFAAGSRWTTMALVIHQSVICEKSRQSTYNVRQVTHVDYEKKWTQDRALGNTR